jgi:hypothetical protein
MTHVLDNHCCIIDGRRSDPVGAHGMTPIRRARIAKALRPVSQAIEPRNAAWRPSLRRSLMLLPDLLIAHHITGQQRYLIFTDR